MIDRVIEFSIRNRTLVIIAGLVLALWGVYALYHTPVDAIPDLSENQVIVFTDWMGHSPREIEDQISYPLSLNLEGLAGVRVVRSSSDFNFSSLSVIFDDSVEFATARQRVAERLARIGHLLPVDVVPKLAPEALATGQIFWYTVEGLGYDLGRLRSVQDWYVRPQLSSVPGVAEVASVGGFPIEYQIEVNPNRLRAFGVTLNDVVQSVARSNSAVGGHVVQKANAEYIVRAIGWIGSSGAGESSEFDPRQALRDIEKIVVTPRHDSVRSTHHSPLTTHHSLPIRVSDVATVSLGASPRRGVLEKDGTEVTGGVVMMRYGENPLEVTRRIKEKIQQLETGLPKGVRIVPCYDRTPLIKGAIGTVTGTLAEAILTASICVLIVLLHFRTSFIIAVTLPLATLTSFVIMWTLRRLGLADIQTNIMSLAGIAISIGVLVDSSIVMAENVMHSLQGHFGDRPVRGDIRELVLPACRTVGRPIFFSVLIMLISFIPVFALGGMEGKMFRPLAFTKSFALLAVAVLAITLVPALCTVFIKGRLRREEESWLVRSFIGIYRPVLDYLLDRPAALAWIMSVTFIVGLAPLGSRWLFPACVFLGIVACGLVPYRFRPARDARRQTPAPLGREARGDGPTSTAPSGLTPRPNPLPQKVLADGWRSRTVAIASLVVIALVANQNMKPLGREFMTPLDEGTVMDMPITVPRASVTQSGDDVRARDMILCRFPEVEMVMGKAGRAETATDPAPLDMIETMVNFRPPELWPRRRLLVSDAERQGSVVLDALVRNKLVQAPQNRSDHDALKSEAVMAALPLFDNVMREFAFLKNQEFTQELARSLSRFAVEQTFALLQESGRLRRKPSQSEITAITTSLPSELIKHLEATPLLEDSTSVARHTARELERLEFVEPSSDLLAYQPSPLMHASILAQSVLGKSPPTFFTRLNDLVLARYRALWRGHVHKLNGEILDRAALTYTRLVTDELLAAVTVIDEKLNARLAEQKRLRTLPTPTTVTRSGHHGGRLAAPPPTVDPYPPLDSLRIELAARFSKRLLLWPQDRSALAGFGGELDRVLQVPGWINVWTMPIQNRVDMLATGVNTAVGVRVLGRSLDDVVRASQEIATVVKHVPGAADVVADPIRGKGYLEVRPDRDKLARYGISVGDVNEVVETALAGKVVTTTVEGRERHAVRVRYARDWRQDEEALKNVLVPVEGSRQSAVGSQQSLAADCRLPTADSPFTTHYSSFIPLAQVADVSITEGPATIKSENGMLRNYVRLNVRGRGVVDFVEQARRVVTEQVKLPEGVYLEWTGQFEQQVRARNSLMLLMPLVVGLIFLILYITYHDFADAVLMMLAVPGAIAGGVFFQWLFGYKFSVAVWVGYIACFGMATATGIIMLVYLREAVAKAGGLANITPEELRQAVINGAVHRLRPKLLTEATTIIGLAPMLWATGTGAEVIKPMAAPVLGGILIADEVIDLFLPVLFYWVRRWRWERIHAASSDQGEGGINETTVKRSTVSSDETADRLAEVGLIHSSFQPVGLVQEYSHETFQKGPT